MPKKTPKAGRKAKTSLDQHFAFAKLYDHFNREVFDGALAPCLLNFSRNAKAFGFFAPDRWVRGQSTRHEISLNPNYLDREPRATCATLVHEMVHAWQAQYGEPSRGGYHNAEWAERMELAGLVPSDTAMPGGKRVGPSVSHYIADGGVFDRAFRKLPKSALLPWQSSEAAKPEAKPRPASKIKYTCSGCDANVWGKPGLSILCGDCPGFLEGSAERFEPGEATG